MQGIAIEGSLDDDDDDDDAPAYRSLMATAEGEDIEPPPLDAAPPTLCRQLAQCEPIAAVS